MSYPSNVVVKLVYRPPYCVSRCVRRSFLCGVILDKITNIAVLGLGNNQGGQSRTYWPSNITPYYKDWAYQTNYG